MRSLRTATKSSPRSPQLEKARVQQRRPNAAPHPPKKKYMSFDPAALLLVYRQLNYMFKDINWNEA